MAVPLDVIKQYAPVVYFHENERFFPCSIEHLLQNSTLTDPATGTVLSPVTQATLQQHPGGNVFITIDPAQYGGMGVTAPIYYAVQEYTDCIQLNYLMLYAYQGGQTCRALRAGTEFNCIVSTLGIHQGDLERVFVTLIPQPQGGYAVARVGYEAHGDEHTFPSQRVEWEGTHPVVNAALNGHSNWNAHADGDMISEFTQPGSVAIVSALGSNGQVWRPADFRLLALDEGGNPVGDQLWAVFQGRLGIAQENSMTSATYFDGSNLSGFDWAFVKLTDWAAKLFDKYPDDLKHGNGPGGPGDRPWIKSVSGKAAFSGLVTLQANDNMGQGPGAVAWLKGPFTALNVDQIVQCWGNGSSLGMILYGVDATGALQTRWSSGNMGEGPGAVAWLVTNIFGDQRREIVQCWGNGSSLGMIMYGGDGSGGLKELWRSDNMGQGPGAVAWLVGDYNGDSQDEIVQCWGNGSSLGMIMYGGDGAGGIRDLWNTGNMGQGPGAVAWLVGDYDGNGKDEIVQCWGNGSSLGMIMYGLAQGGGLAYQWANPNMGEGPGAVAWQVGDFNGDGKDEIVQCWGNGSSLGMIMYGSDGSGGLKKLWRSDNMGEGPGAKSWKVGDYNRDGKDEIVQCWGNGSSLGMIMYGSDGTGGLKELWRSDNMGEGPGAVTWQVGDFNADGRAEIIQGWGNGSSLGLVMYGIV